ncbi:hypothetical protein CLHOM_00850 [Clostridium homopropionicum DSM 5847]|uniref:Type 4 fimbrial biogenesis protein PilX N-terminal domain-containing protein n=1 Tax=Clostridium homopropionicum DSM 5847 TaxID=1121318 RepID=A0A0L6ZEJ9_9CLOT|nr:pilus assembly PilX N-terminal domain-containing protein [Clostridium homopropionicum]KOA21414.1 hypothetical protein CLHOM_00850 [Clostridium homopropionicum DSM 5847]SFG10642.1 hypothetical protein SAMN04488501_105141 [Clostridium homopropionicum]
MKLKKVKKGSSFVMIVMVMAVLSILGIAISSLAVTSYRARSLNEVSKKNFYITESGLDKAYAIIGKLVDGAIASGNSYVESAMNDLNLNDEKVIEANKEPGTEGSLFIKDDGSVDEAYIKVYQNSVFRSAYTSFIEGSIRTSVESGNYELSENGSNPQVSVLSSNDELKFAPDKMLIKLESKFKEKDLEKVIHVNYEIGIPEYNSVYYVKSDVTKLPPSNITFLNSISIDGDMIVQGNDVDITGNIFVKGNESSSNKDTKGVILQNNNSNLKITGEMITPSNIVFNGNDNKFTSKGNVYVNNTRVLKVSEGTKIDITGDLNTNDDLEISGKKSQVDIKGGLYAVNEGSGDPNPDKSSSIIINSDDLGSGTSLNITSDVMVAGSSYINLNNNVKYQTGESLSIKGNYKAYAMPLPEGPYSEDKMIFEFLEPLNLVTGFLDGSQFLIKEKSEYFTEFNRLFPGQLTLGGNGIRIGGTIKFNTGALVHDGVIKSWDVINEQDLKEKTIELKRKIYYMGETTESNDNVYNQNSVQVKVANRINFNEMENVRIINQGSNEKELLLLNKDENKSLVILGKDGNDGSSILGDKDIIDLNKDKAKGVIVTKGNVYFCGDIDFSGTIICGGNFVLMDGAKDKILYNKNYVDDLVNKYPDYFDNILNADLITNTDYEVGVDNSVVTDIERDKLIIRKGWELMK